MVDHLTQLSLLDWKRKFRAKLQPVLQSVYSHCTTTTVVAAVTQLVEAEIVPLLSELKETKKHLGRVQECLVRVQDAAGRDDSDAFAFNFMDKNNHPCQLVCSRALVRQWSPVFDALVRNGNGLGNDFPKEVRLPDEDPDVFKDIIHFMTHGALSEEHVPQLEVLGHPLLECADRYDLRNLVDEYFAVLLRRQPLDKLTAPRVLELALLAHATVVREKAVAVIAEDGSVFQPFGKDSVPRFCRFTAEVAAAVLAHDELRVSAWVDLHGQRFFHESAVSNIALLWAKQHPSEADRVVQLFDSVRFELFSYVELADLRATISSSDLLGPQAKAKINAAIAEALQQRLSRPADAASRVARKRQHSALADANGEENMLKVLRMALELSGPPTQDAAPPSTAASAGQSQNR